MNKNTLIGTILISMLIMYYVSSSALNTKIVEENTTEQIEDNSSNTTSGNSTINTDSNNPEVLENDSTAAANQEIQSQGKYGAFYANANGNEEIITLENNLIKVDLSSKGAQVSKVQLKEFKTWDKKELFVIDNSQSLDFKFLTNDNKLIETKDLFYEVKKLSDKSVSLKLKVNDGKYLEQIYSIEDDSYFVDFSYNFVGLTDVLNASDYNLQADWAYTVIQQEKGLTLEKQKSTIYWKEREGDVENLSPGRSKDEVYTNVEWISFKDQFFNSTFLTDGVFDDGSIKTIIDTEDTTKIGRFYAEINFEKLATPNYNFQYYFGPNDYKLLKSYDRGQENVVELSADFFLFRWVKHITKWVILPIFHFLDGFNLNYGLIIILLTLIIKMALMPLTFKSYVSTAKTKLLKPQIDKLKEKYKDDQQKFASEQMKLYQTTGVSMFGGCLPMLLQMPFLLAMFYFFPSSIELRQESFLWATDLSTYDVLINLPFKIPLYGAHVSGFTLLMTISSLISAKFNPQMQNNNAQPGMEMMKYMPYIFPFFLMFLFNTWSAALTFYYFLSNVITLAQQFLINKYMIDEEKLLQKIEDNKKKPQKKGGFRSKMADIYKQQQLEQEKNKK